MLQTMASEPYTIPYHGRWAWKTHCLHVKDPQRCWETLFSVRQAIIIGVKKFHNFIYGRHFTIQSDHQLLSYLFDEQKGIPQHAPAFIQRWSLILSAYRYSIRCNSNRHSSSSSSSQPKGNPSRASRDSSRHQQNEEPTSGGPTHRLRHHGSSPLLQYLPEITTFTSDSSSPPLGLARKALEPFAFRLCWTL